MGTIQTKTIETKKSSEMPEDKQLYARRMKQKRLKKVMFSLFGIAIFFFLTTVYSQYQVYILKKLEAVNEITHPVVPVTPNQIVEAVSKHILLPDTIPQIATVEDAQALSKSKEFFKDVLNGDAVLVYETMIIVYRPSLDIIIAVGDVTGVPK